MTASSAAAAPWQGTARIEAGAEHDTNPARLERVDGLPAAKPIAGSGVARASLSLDLGVPIGERLGFALASSVAAKRFLETAAQAEDVLVVQVVASQSVFLAPRMTLTLAGSYYDVFQRADTIEDARDFRSASPTARFETGLGAAGRLSLGAGWRWFEFKPSSDFDFDGPTASAAFRQVFASDVLAGGADWEWSLSALGERRSYRGRPCVSANACLPADSATRRLDHFWLGQLEVTRTGDALFGAGVATQVNLSNSYGEEVARLLVHARAVVLLPWSLSVSGRGELVFTRFYDAVPLARAPSGTPLVSIEDEGRSTLRLEIARPLGPSFDVGARYTLYTNELVKAPVEFSRQTFLIFVAALFEK